MAQKSTSLDFSIHFQQFMCTLNTTHIPVASTELCFLKSLRIIYHIYFVDTSINRSNNNLIESYCDDIICSPALLTGLKTLRLHPLQRVKTAVRGQTLAEVKIQNGIFQGDFSQSDGVVEYTDYIFVHG